MRMNQILPPSRSNLVHNFQQISQYFFQTQFGWQLHTSYSSVQERTCLCQKALKALNFFAIFQFTTTNVPVDGQMFDGKAPSPFFFLLSNRFVFQLRLTSLRSLNVLNILVILQHKADQTLLRELIVQLLNPTRTFKLNT